jgi:hypothetical protein
MPKIESGPAIIVEHRGRRMRELFFWMIAAGTCLGGALVAMRAQQQGDMLSVGIIMVICFVISVVCINDSHNV